MKLTAKLRSPNLWLALIILMGLVYLYFHDPRAAGGLWPPCLFNTLTGYYCPGCGSSRAIYQLLHGNIWTAIRLNPLNIVLLPALGAVALLIHGWSRHTGHPVPAWLRHPVWLWLLVAIISAFWIIRNIPGTGLAPF